MEHVHLLIPGLFPPPDIAAEACAGLRVPVLERLLSRAGVRASATGTLEDRFCAAFGVQAVAPVRAAADGLETGGSYWLCADPVNLQLQHAQVMLLDVVPGPDEANALCASLNEHFTGMGLRFSAPHPQRWYVQLEAEPQMTTSPLRLAAGSDAKLHQPQGTDALGWQRIATEVQMLLYAHPVNRAREARGEMMVGSLWFWGGGRARPPVQVFDAVGGDGELVGMFARVAGIPRPASLQAMFAGDGKSGLWACGMPDAAMRRGDVYAWREAVQQVEREQAQPLLQALQAGRLRRLTLEVICEQVVQRFELERGDAWKLWRAARSLAGYAV
ncbi:hypothetical protein MIZ01_1206 [Sideroxyarcus emersonii]|uniref:Uncharacterized protein n=1 Tax=Sideroxyarcus emersonii TaxID=2764705 RepID=A0AAN2BYU5_9PROT|nr:hypothetical protein [Sideroxyarcus emersonii]BCK87428.1 hypothetical protein MIZ01_1206 [Sideroxyarcus emersonii]